MSNPLTSTRRCGCGCGSTAKEPLQVRDDDDSQPRNCPVGLTAVWPVWLHSAVGLDRPCPLLPSNTKNLRRTKILARSLLSFLNSTQEFIHAHSIEEKQPLQTSTAVLADLPLFSCSIDVLLLNHNSFLRPQRTQKFCRQHNLQRPRRLLHMPLLVIPALC